MTALSITGTRRFFFDPVDDLISTYNEEKIKTNAQVEESMTSITQQNSKNLNIDELMEQRKPYIQERNKILNNPLKYHLPYFRRKLSLIDKHLDILEFKIYSIESENFNIQDLQEMQFSAERKLRKYSKS